VAVAVLQLYGQERNERYRKTADDAVKQQGDAVKQQGIVLRRIADTVEQQGIEINRIGADLRRIADGIGAIASQEEETEGEDESDLTWPSQCGDELLRSSIRNFRAFAWLTQIYTNIKTAPAIATGLLVCIKQNQAAIPETLINVLRLPKKA
jgi:hypothetical protein